MNVSHIVSGVLAGGVMYCIFYILCPVHISIVLIMFICVTVAVGVLGVSRAGCCPLRLPHPHRRRRDRGAHFKNPRKEGGCRIRSLTSAGACCCAASRAGRIHGPHGPQAARGGRARGGARGETWNGGGRGGGGRGRQRGGYALRLVRQAAACAVVQQARVPLLHVGLRSGAQQAALRSGAMLFLGGHSIYCTYC